MIPAIAGGVVVLGLAVFTWRYVRRQRLHAAMAAKPEPEADDWLGRSRIIDGWIIETGRNPALVYMHCGTCATTYFALNLSGNPATDEAVRLGLSRLPACHDEDGVRLNDE